MRSSRKNVFVALSAFVGLVVLAAGLAGPAAADPSTQFVAVGSDTTQDVVNAFATNRGLGVLGSWDAVNPVTGVAGEIITPKAGCSMTRPNGSTAGREALRKSLNPATTAPQLADPPEPGCVDIARSSSGPGTNQSAAGLLQYIPFGLDAVAVATGPATNFGAPDPATATVIVDANSFTQAQLTTMYHDCGTITVGTMNYVPDGTVTDATHTPIHLYIPQSGSGTRSFWASTLGGFNATTPPVCVHDHSVLPANTLVEEHDGTVIAADPNGIAPFSIAQWVAQGNGHHERRHHAVLRNLNGITPLSGSVLNPSFPIKREVYNIVSRAAVVAGAGNNAALTNLLVSPNPSTPSIVCADSFTLASYGFGSLDGSPLTHTCGQIADDLRAFATI